MKTKQNMRSGAPWPHIFPTLAKVGESLGVATTRNAFLLITAGLLAITPMCFSADMRNPHLVWSKLPALPNTVGLGGCFAGESGGALLVADGCNFPGKPFWEGGKKAWYDTVYVLKKPDGQWQSVGKLPHALAYGVSVTTKHGLVCIGGADASRHYAEVLALSWSRHGLQISKLPSLPLPLAYAAAAAVGDTIYVVGGLSKPGAQSASDKFLALDISEKNPAWKELEPCPGRPRMLATAGALDGAFYLAGGTALREVKGKVERTYLQDAWCYNPGQGWRRLAHMPKACSAGATPAPTFDSALFLIGGDDGSLTGFKPIEKHPGFSRRILAYHTGSDTWSIEPEAPFPRATVQTAFWRGRYVFVGGEVRPGVRSPEVWALSFAGGQ